MFDFKKETGPSHLYNFHSHSQYCDGAGPLELYVQEALRQGFTHYGFSPHAPISIASPCNMRSDDVAAYISEVDALKRDYADRIRLYASMEIDYLSRNECAANHYFQSLPLDYRISSVHFLPAADGNYYDIDGPYDRFKNVVDNHFGGDIRRVSELFFEQSIAMVRAGGFDLIGHFDKIAQNGTIYCPQLEDESWYEDCIRALVDEIARAEITVEINTKYYTRLGRVFPHKRWHGLLAGLPTVVNSDAHRPESISAGRAEWL